MNYICIYYRVHGALGFKSGLVLVVCRLNLPRLELLLPLPGRTHGWLQRLRGQGLGLRVKG